MPDITLYSAGQHEGIVDNLAGRLQNLQDDDAGDSADAEAIDTAMQLLQVDVSAYPHNITYYDSNVEQQLATTLEDLGEIELRAAGQTGTVAVHRAHTLLVWRSDDEDAGSEIGDWWCAVTQWNRQCDASFATARQATDFARDAIDVALDSASTQPVDAARWIAWQAVT